MNANDIKCPKCDGDKFSVTRNCAGSVIRPNCDLCGGYGDIDPDNKEQLVAWGLELAREYNEAADELEWVKSGGRPAAYIPYAEKALAAQSRRLLAARAAYVELGRISQRRAMA